MPTQTYTTPCSSAAISLFLEYGRATSKDRNEVDLELEDGT
ncbi:hypothetical protein AZE42_12028 [Rhizopogon vesiculosus]|uniref:Uncharacterized protein n=1 Tax=Rhizopogon vesiculosus TaxID=180088 RepID=A0A1J8Q239_9AGAM|nr:hypothetical protein AZE42_12028 [Rhizopogon vesiculosus]